MKCRSADMRRRPASAQILHIFPRNSASALCDALPKTDARGENEMVDLSVRGMPGKLAQDSWWLDDVAQGRYNTPFPGALRHWSWPRFTSAALLTLAISSYPTIWRARGGRLTTAISAKLGRWAHGRTRQTVKSSANAGPKLLPREAGEIGAGARPLLHRSRNIPWSGRLCRVT